MYSATASFGIEFLKNGHRLPRQFELMRKFYDELGIPSNGITATLDLDSPGLGQLMARLGDPTAGSVRLRGGNLRIHPQVKSEDAWYIIEWTVLCLAGTNGHPVRLGDDLPFDEHIEGHIVSEKFRDTVLEAGLIGMDFVLVRQLGKRNPANWFAPVIEASLGRGLDHEWFDPATLEGEHLQPGDLPWRHGVYRFNNTQLTASASFGDDVKDAFLRGFDVGDLTINANRTVVRDRLPAGDFATMWWGSGSERCIACSERARNALVSAGMLHPTAFCPIAIVDSVPSGTVDLDTLGPQPPSLYNYEMLSLVRAESEVAYAAAVANPIQIPKPDLALMIERLRLLASDYPHISLSDPATAEEIAAVNAQLPRSIPAAWQAVLMVTDGFDLSTGSYDLYMQSSWNLPAFQAMSDQVFRSGRLPDDPDRLPDTLLHIGNDANEYVLSLNVAQVDESGDCPVWWSSEGSCKVEWEWPSIAHFLENMLNLAVAEKDDERQHGDWQWM